MSQSSKSQPLNDPSYSEKRQFVVKLGRALHKYGTPSYRLESHLENVCELLDIQAEFMATPTSINFSFKNSDTGQDDNHIARAQPGGLDLGALGRTDAVVERLGNGNLTLAEADHRLDEIAHRSSSYPTLLNVLVYALTGGAFALLLHGSWLDAASAAIISLLVFVLMLLAEHSRRVAHMLEPLAALVAAFVATAISHSFSNINIPLVVLSSIIVLIPGLALLQGLSELSAKHMVSGSARVMYALMQLFLLFFGSILGATFAKLALGDIQANTSAPAIPPLPDWYVWPTLLTLGLCLAVSMKARVRDIPWVLCSALLAYSAALWGVSMIGVTLGAFVGAFAVGSYSNLFARLAKRPALIVSLPGLLVLVPGSKVFMGLNSFVSGTDAGGDAIGPQAFIMFLSLVAGVIFANVAIAPKRSL